jgi:hypothetical protein|tara:strand:+ start:8820 stop:9251 length:432 start_codon:yes stop_codon:yes gene_type:complete
MTERKWVPSFSELIDRLAIYQLKEVFIPEHKQMYIDNMLDIMEDLDRCIKEENIELSAELIRAIVVISQINLHIWNSESQARRGEDQDLKLLKFTHSINGIRNKATNHISRMIGQNEKQDFKTDCLAAEFSDWDIDLSAKREG